MCAKKASAKPDTPAAFDTKIKLRELVSDHLGGVRSCHVFDAFAGSGKIHDAIWKDAASYTGCDKRYLPDGRYAYVCEVSRLLRAISLERFNVFDFDSDDSPWEQAVILSARRKVQLGETVGVLLSERASMSLRMGGLSTALQNMTGVSARFKERSEVSDRLYDRAIAEMARRMRCDVLKRWQAEQGGKSKTTWIALVLRGKGGEVAPTGKDDAVGRVIAAAVEHADVSEENGREPKKASRKRKPALV